MDWTETFGYIVNSVAWSGLGAVIGYFLGRSSREVHDLWTTTVVPETGKRVEVTTPEQAAGEVDDDARHRRSSDMRRSRLDLAVAVFVGILAAVSVGYSVTLDRAQQASDQCYADHYRDVDAALRARTEASDVDRASLTRLVTDVVGARSREESEAALQAYLQRVRAAEKIREQTPLPELTPDQACPQPSDRALKVLGNLLTGALQP